MHGPCAKIKHHPIVPGAAILQRSVIVLYFLIFSDGIDPIQTGLNAVPHLLNSRSQLGRTVSQSSTVQFGEMGPAHVSFEHSEGILWSMCVYTIYIHIYI